VGRVDAGGAGRIEKIKAGNWSGDLNFWRFDPEPAPRRKSPRQPGGPRFRGPTRVRLPKYVHLLFPTIPRPPREAGRTASGRAVAGK